MYRSGEPVDDTAPPTTLERKESERIRVLRGQPLLVRDGVGYALIGAGHF